MTTTRNLLTSAVLTLCALLCATITPPGFATAAECGPGTVYDATTDLCMPAPPPPAPPPPPPPPAWNGDPTPGFSVGFCLPIPFVAVCFGT